LRRTPAQKDAVTIRARVFVFNYQLSIKNKRAKVTFFSKMSQFFLYDGDADEADVTDFH
jgi:hypothetical protein